MQPKFPKISQLHNVHSIMTFDRQRAAGESINSEFYNIIHEVIGKYKLAHIIDTRSE